jgi:hypothetical protein
VFIDERSMVSQRVLGSAEMNIRSTAHGGGHDNEDWGGIPVVILFGDDFQLTPPCEEGAIDAFDNQGYSTESKNGAYQFIKLGGSTSELEEIIHQDKNQEEFRDIFKNKRAGHPSNNNTETILSLHLGDFSVKEQEEIESKALFVFANKRKMQEHNWERLKAEHSINNPIARMRVKGRSKGKEIRNLPKCFKQDSDIESVLNDLS